ncbi:MAG: hypothetical protein N2C12_02725 [Planctomycetales bacterium]
MTSANSQGKNANMPITSSLTIGIIGIDNFIPAWNFGRLVQPCYPITARDRFSTSTPTIDLAADFHRLRGQLRSELHTFKQLAGNLIPRG